MTEENGTFCENLLSVNFDNRIMSTGNTILCFIAGAATGAIAALLLAPDSGANTRAKIRQGASDAAGLAKEKILEGLDIIEKALEGE